MVVPYTRTKNINVKNNMKTKLRVISREGSEYFDIPNPYNMTPRKDDHIVWQEESYMVDWVEFDFDTNTLYIIVVKN